MRAGCDGNAVAQGASVRSDAGVSCDLDLHDRAKPPDRLSAPGPALLRDPDDPADQALDQAQRNARLHAAVAQLPDAQEKLLRLAYFEDKSHSAIAEELTLPLGTVKSRLRLAMAKLRAALESLE